MMARTTHERRRHQRRLVLLECWWGRGAHVTDLSFTGCYVAAVVVPDVGERIESSMQLMEEVVTLRGRVVHAEPAKGFGMQFEDLDGPAAVAVYAFVRNGARHS